MRLYHDSRSLDCRAPFGAVRCGEIIRLRVYVEGHARAVNAVFLAEGQAPRLLPLQQADGDAYEVRFCAPHSPKLM